MQMKHRWRKGFRLHVLRFRIRESVQIHVHRWAGSISKKRRRVVRPACAAVTERISYESDSKLSSYKVNPQRISSESKFSVKLKIALFFVIEPRSNTDGTQTGKEKIALPSRLNQYPCKSVFICG